MTSRSWADRMSDSEDEPMQYDGVSFSDSETDEDQSQAEVEEVSEKTKKFLQKCTQRVSNTEKALKEHYHLPKVPATRTRLDPMMKPEAYSATTTADKQLAKVQTLFLDSMAPLASVVESHNRGESFKEKEMVDAVKAAIQLVGNAQCPHVTPPEGESGV